MRPEDAEAFIYLTQKEKTNVRRDLRTLKIHHDRPIEFRSNCLFLVFTIPAHLLGPHFT